LGPVIVVASERTEVMLGAIEAGLEGRGARVVVDGVRRWFVESVEERCWEAVVVFILY